VTRCELYSIFIGVSIANMRQLLFLYLVGIAHAAIGQYVVRRISDTETGLAMRLQLDGKGPAKYGVWKAPPALPGLEG
jgi:hypothetical protein